MRLHFYLMLVHFYLPRVNLYLTHLHLYPTRGTYIWSFPTYTWNLYKHQTGTVKAENFENRKLESRKFIKLILEFEDSDICVLNWEKTARLCQSM